MALESVDYAFLGRILDWAGLFTQEEFIIGAASGGLCIPRQDIKLGFSQRSQQLLLGLRLPLSLTEVLSFRKWLYPGNIVHTVFK